MNFFLLENNFYNDYSNCTEILKKSNRPYAVFLIKLNNLTFAVPVRSHITHKYSIKTIENKGLDFSKAVIINNIQRYISKKHERSGAFAACHTYSRYKRRTFFLTSCLCGY